MTEPSGTQYGGFWVRAIALLADSAIVFLCSALVIVGAAMTLGAELAMPIALGVTLAGALYWPVMHASRRQATFGKAIVGLKVTRFDGRRISFLRSLWREIAKFFSSAVVMLGYVMAAFTPRKQGLHDLMSATYVVREGPARVVAALAVAVGGFAIPMVVAPMILGAAMVANMTSMAQGLVSEHQPTKPQATKSAPRPIAAAPKAPPKPAPAAPAVVAKAPEQPAAPPPAAAPAPAPVAAPAPSPAATPAPALAAAPQAKPATESKPEAVAAAMPPKKQASAKPKSKVASANAKPDTSGMKVAARPSRPAAQPDELKRVTGLRHNDLMSAVLDSDVESVNTLLRMGKWADKPDSQGVTPLMMATERGDLKVAEALLRGGADGRSASQVAQKRGDGDMMVLFARYRR
jgi:uncharacterized RDD family membrane protein YckC